MIKNDIIDLILSYRMIIYLTILLFIFSVGILWWGLFIVN